jgi:hypothetical protein
MLRSALADLPLAFDFLMALAQARQPDLTPEGAVVDELELGTEDVTLAAWLA